MKEGDKVAAATGSSKSNFFEVQVEDLPKAPFQTRQAHRRDRQSTAHAGKQEKGPSQDESTGAHILYCGR